MSDEPQRSPRWDLPTLRTFLNRLDRVADRFDGPDSRCWDRWSYRVKALQVELLDEDQAVTARYAATARNLSRQGVALLNERLIYPGTACRARLVGPRSHEQLVVGDVAHCRYVVGSGSLYDVGVKFRRLIDLPAFVPHARHVRILVVDADATLPPLLGSFLNGLSAELTTGIVTPGDVVKAAFEGRHDLVLIDLEDPGVDALSMTAQLRRLGYVAPVVGLAVQIGEDLYNRCAQAGCTGYLRKPITRDGLRRLVLALMDRPLVSTLAHDVTVAPLIDQFVSRLPQCAKQMAFAFEYGDLYKLDQIAHDLRGEAGSYGFGVITEAATEVQTLIASRESVARTRYGLNQLMHLCLTARPATYVEAVTEAG